MEEILKGPVQHWIHDWGYMAVFLGIMLENAGIPLPGETIIVIASILASQHYLDVWHVLGYTIAGAIIGPNFGYYVGLRGGRPLLLKMARMLRMSVDELERAEGRFQRHSDMAIFGGRFIAFLRIFASPIAGMIRMPFHRFFIFNALGAIVWCSVIVGLAYFLGEYAAILLRNVGITLLAVLIIAAVVLAYRVRRERRAKAAVSSPVESPGETSMPTTVGQE